MVRMSLSELQNTILPNHKRGRKRQPPALVPIDERNIHQYRPIVLLHRLRNAISHAKLPGNFRTFVRKHRKRQEMPLNRKVILPRQLRRNRHQQRTFRPNLRIKRLPNLKFRHAIRTPATPKELHNHRPNNQQIGAPNHLSRKRIRQSKRRSNSTNAKHPSLNIRRHQILNVSISNGQTIRLHQRPRRRCNRIELRLKIRHCNHSKLHRFV